MKWKIKYHGEKLQADVLALPPGMSARYFHCPLVDRKIVMRHQFVKKPIRHLPKNWHLHASE